MPKTKKPKKVYALNVKLAEVQSLVAVAERYWQDQPVSQEDAINIASVRWRLTTALEHNEEIDT